MNSVYRSLLAARPNRKAGIDASDYAAAARDLGVEIATIRAVDAVESAGSGFLKSGRVKILFEGHLFYKKLKKHGLAVKVSKKHSSIAYPKWTTRHYIGGEGEYHRLETAIRICTEYSLPETLALECASYSRFQILGENYKDSGFRTVIEFVDAMFLDEDNALEAFVSFVEANNLDDELRRKDWAGFAEGYNGPAYRRNNYHIKLPNAYDRFVRLGANNLSAKQLRQDINKILPCTDETCIATRAGLEHTSLDDRYAAAIPLENANPENLSNPSPTPSLTDSAVTNASDLPALSASIIPDNNPTENAVSNEAELGSSPGSALDSLSSAAGKVAEVKDKVLGFGIDFRKFVPFFRSFARALQRQIFNITTAVFAFFAEMPWYLWLALAVVATIVIYRKEILSYVRSTKPAAGAPANSARPAEQN